MLSISQANASIYSCYILDGESPSEAFQHFPVNREGYELIASFFQEVVSRVEEARRLREHRLKEKFWNG